MTRALAFACAILAVGVPPAGASLDTDDPEVAPLHSLVGLTDQGAARMMDALDPHPARPPTRKRSPHNPAPGPERWREP